LRPDFSEKSKFKTAPKTTVKLTNLLKVEPKKEEGPTTEIKQDADQDFSFESLQLAWRDFAEQRKKFQAEFQMLSQPFDLNQNRILVHLLNPVQENMLSSLKSELTTYLREKLKNNSIHVTGELREMDEKKMKYTDRDKFEFLLDKNPLLQEMKDRLGLDTDF
jgi:hypothetical protein